MREDQFEKFVRDHRDDFDSDMPSPALWEKIEGEITEQQRRSLGLRRIIRIAAIFLLGAVSYAIADYLLSPKEETLRLSHALRVHHFQTSPAYRQVIPNENRSQKNDPLSPAVNQFADNNKKINPKEKTSKPSDEFQEMQVYYAMQIESRRREIFRFASNRPEIEQQINLEFSEIDSIYNDLKKDLNDNIDNREVIEAMILNYRVRLEMLDAILQQLKEKNEANNEKHKSYEI
jgi:hypothetical protein